MGSAGQLLPLAVALPLGVAALMLMSAHWLPSKIPDVLSLAATVSVMGLCAWLAVRSHDADVVQWIGGWQPVHGVALGIAMVADPASAAIATLAAVVVCASLVFAWGFFDEVHAHFHILMLLFLAAMVGFCFTRDLFNLFVWFELMSVAAYALTAYELGASSLEGGLNFTVVNSLGSITMLAGVGLLYARAGQLDFDAVGAVVCQRDGDAVTAAAFCLIASALLTKAAVIPFQPWLPDAHGVAPSPVSVVFSAVMVPLGLFGLAKIAWQVFGHCAAEQGLLHGLLLPLGAATAVVGAVMSWQQRHLKRLLGFSTIAHMGVALIGAMSGQAFGAAGLLAYIVGHAFVKGALFMIAGMLLAVAASNDEIDLLGRGKDMKVPATLMVLAALLLAGAPWGILHAGGELLGSAGAEVLPLWARFAMVFAGAVTGAAVLRAAGRIFFGWGGRGGIESESPTESSGEPGNRSIWLMLAPCVGLLLLALVPASLVTPFVLEQGARLARLPAQAAPKSLAAAGWAMLSTSLAVAIAGVALARSRVPPGWRRWQDHVSGALRSLRHLHSGLVTDYIAWAAVGLAALGAALLRT